ncbi:ABC transporter substrate-binding protein [Phytohabitans suffuscus]
MRLRSLAGGVAVCAALALAACGADSDPPDSATGSVLTVAVPDDIQTLDPMYANFARAHNALQQIYDTPVNLETQDLGNGQLVGTPDKLKGSAFESWQRSADGLTYTVKIRQGMTFHDGSPVTAEDVVYSFDRALNTKGGANWLLTQIAFVTKAPTVVDPATITITADKPSALAIQALYMDGLAILDQDEVKSHATADDPWAEKWLAKNVGNGSGPYKLTSRVPDQEVVFEAFDGYWAGAPKIKKIVWKIVPSAAQRLALLKSGDVDIAESLPPDQLASLKGVDGVTVLSAASQNVAIVGMNNGRAPLSDKALRQGISYAVDYDRILSQVFQGEAERLYGPVPKGAATSLGDTIGYKQDVDKAKQLVSGSGYGGGTIKIAFDNSKGLHEQIAVLLRSQLSAVGVTAELEPLTSAVFSERKAKKDLDMYVDESLAWINDPDYILSLTFQCEVYGNYADYCSPVVDDAIAKGWAMEATDPARVALFENAQRVLVDDAPWLFLAQPNYRMAMSSQVQGFVVRQNEVPFYYDLSLQG